MPRLPQTIDFDPTAFPELAEIFLAIDAGIAAIVASDPAMRPRTAVKRRKNPTGMPAKSTRMSRSSHQLAA
jgi:hypothetical protein